MTGAVDQKHPAYVEAAPDWEQLRDTHRGERAVKARGFRYLPPTQGQRIDGIDQPTQDGWKSWDAYRTRAVFPESVSEAVETMLGVMHYKPPVIELPAAMEPLLESASIRRESLAALLRRINEEQLTMGRVGLLAEAVPDDPLPKIALYHAEHIINWDDGSSDDEQADALNLVVLDESSSERIRGFEWDHVDKYRVLVLGDPMALEPEESGAVYRAGVFKEKATFTEEALLEPSIRGKTLDRIPFVFANTRDIVADVDKPPLLGLSNLTLTIYRGEADYRQALFMQGQDTLVTIGAINTDGTPRRVGAGAEISLPAGPGNDAKFIGVDSAGLSEMREALVADYARAEKKAEALIEAVGRAAESGEALRVRVAARTASLTQVALTGAFALQELLRIIAVWVGANPEEVKVTPNLDFVADLLKGQELAQIMSSKMLGAPLSLRTIHEICQNRGLTTRTFEEELEEMKRETEAGLPGTKDPSDPNSETADGEEGEEGEHGEGMPPGGPPGSSNPPQGGAGEDDEDDEPET